MKNPILTMASIVLMVTVVMATGDVVAKSCGGGAGKVKDEAMCAGRSAESMPGATDDYYRDMDYGVTKNPQALAKALAPYVPGITPEQATRTVAAGRNNWIVWTAGNDRFWDALSKTSFGTLDFLKVVSNHPSLKASRDNRWYFLGLVNEPCFDKGAAPRKDRFGLYLDTRSADCPPDPFEDEVRYPGVKTGARGRTVPVGSYYGYGSGIVGLRLFPNPDFDEKAAKAWDPERYYTDPSYYNNKNLVKPYRVGMSCGFCHVGPNPTNPPADPEHPKWENLNSNPGAQYFWIDRIFSYTADPTSFPYQLFHTSRPGALDTSLVSTDYINNPRTMNAVYNLGPRMINALRFGQETLAQGGLDNAQLNQYVPIESPLNDFFRKPDTVLTPRVLKDGADSVGALGALNRVFVNIGEFSEEWTEHFRPLVGGKKVTPFPIATARKNSSYWKATEMQTPNLALFFLASTQPDYLKNAPGGDKYLTATEQTLNQGREVFGERCARCHSSKLPSKAYTFFPNNGCAGPNYLNCWNDYWKWTKTDEFKTQIKAIVNRPDFLKDNYLSTDLRVPVTLLETNACSPLATNGLRDNIWDNFTSESYKTLPSVGKITVHHPITGEPYAYDMPDGGRGYTRVPSLASVWATAPFLVNNAVGTFYPSGSVDDRLKSFDDSIEQMLWPEKRKGNRAILTASGKILQGQVDLTTDASYLRIPKGYLPTVLQPLAEPLEHKASWLFDDQGLEIGPIPKGTPVNLVSNMDLDPTKLGHLFKVAGVLKDVKKALKAIPPGATDAEAAQVFANRDLVDKMLSINKCPDFVVNRGHYFGTDYLKDQDEPGLSDGEKRALIAFLKMF